MEDNQSSLVRGTMFLSQLGHFADGSDGFFLVDQGGFIITTEEINNLLDKIASSYTRVGKEWIDNHNNELYDEYFNRERVIERSKTESKKRKSSPGFVYLIKCEGYYKIGMSNDPKNRIPHLSVLTPFNTSAICVIESEDMRLLEKQLHDKFTDKRVNGEWFVLSDEDVEYIKRIATEVYS